MRIKILMLLILLVLSRQALQATPVISGDSNPADMSKLAMSARSYGMGGVGVAIADDSGGFSINPAGLAGMNSKELTTMSSSQSGFYDSLFLSYVHPSKIGTDTFGAAFISQDFGSLYRTDLDPNNGYREYVTGTFTARDYMMIGAYGRRLEKHWYVGAQFRYVNKRIENSVGNSLDLDLGTIYSVNSIVSVGAVYKNILSTGLSYSNANPQVERPESYIKLGVAVELLNKDLTFGADYSLDRVGRLQLGGEYWLMKNLALRAGWNQGIPSLGTGLRYGAFEIDYAMIMGGEALGNQALLSITFGDARASEVQSPDIYLDENAPVKNEIPAVDVPLSAPNQPVIELDQ